MGAPSVEGSRRGSSSTSVAPKDHGWLGDVGELRDVASRNLRWHVECADGVAYDVRPIRPKDGPALRTFHGSLSERTTYLRYFSSHPALSDDEVRRFTHVDYVRRLALVAEDGGGLIAVGRFDTEAGTSKAEVAFVVDDRHQCHGIGSLLLDLLVVAARERGVTTFVVETLAENRGMLHVVYHSGFSVASRRDHETVTLEFPIAPTVSYCAELARRHSHYVLTRNEPVAPS
jgi:GNAT superfamily N-acetyltransferase